MVIRVVSRYFAVKTLLSGINVPSVHFSSVTKGCMSLEMCGIHCSKIMKPPQSLPLQMAEHLLRAQPDSVANHVTARSISDWRALTWLATETGWAWRKRSSICSGKLSVSTWFDTTWTGGTASTLCSKKRDAKIQFTITTAYLIRISLPLSNFNYRLSGSNVANFNQIHHTVSEQQLIKKWNLKTEFSNMENTN